MRRVVKLEKTLKAIEDSRDKWDDICHRMKHGWVHPCPLCQVFADRRMQRRKCMGCPLHERGRRAFSCCKEWQDAYTSGWAMVKRLDVERKKILERIKERDRRR
jgi:hypothetical protein